MSQRRAANAKTGRNEAIYERVRRGERRQEVAAEFGISVRRVSQIVWQEEKRRYLVLSIEE